jgi:prevent-host-death family protein
VNWSIAEAQNRLSEVLTRAATEGPQTIRRSDEDFVLLRADEYAKLSDKRPTFKEWLLDGPGMEGVDVSRNSSPMREPDL